MSAPQHSEVTGVILAGGSSRRFGEDKALHLVDGTPMIVHVYRALSQVADSVVISGRDAVDILPDVLAFADSAPGQGPLSGIHTVMNRAPSEWYLVAACDIPRITTDVLARLLAARQGDAEAVVARTPDGRLQPLCACYQRFVRATISRRLETGERSMHGFLSEISGVIEIDVPEAPLRNINRPEDLQR